MRSTLFYVKVAACGLGTAFAWFHMVVPMLIAMAVATWAAFND